MGGYVFAKNALTESSFPLWVTICGVSQTQEAISRQGGWPDYQWLQCIEGVGILHINNETFRVERGQGILLYPDTPHWYFAVEMPWRMSWLSFHGSLAHGLLSSLDLPASRVVTIQKPIVILDTIDDIYVRLLTHDPLSYLDCSSLLYDLLLNIYRYSSHSNAQQKREKYDRILPAIKYVEENFSTPISLQDLADALSVTPQYTCVLFKKALGVRPAAFVNSVKIRIAKEMVVNNLHWDIQTIAGRVGFDSVSYFVSVFRKNEGITPAEYRARYLDGSKPM